MGLTGILITARVRGKVIISSVCLCVCSQGGTPAMSQSQMVQQPGPGPRWEGTSARCQSQTGGRGGTPILLDRRVPRLEGGTLHHDWMGVTPASGLDGVLPPPPPPPRKRMAMPRAVTLLWFRSGGLSCLIIQLHRILFSTNTI